MDSSAEKISKDLAKGASIIFAGIFLMYVIKLCYRIVVSRYLGPEEYGLLSLGDMIMNFGYLIALIGLDVGLMKHLAYYREKNDIARMKGTFWLTLIISGALSVIIVLLLVLFSKPIAEDLFKNPKFTPVLIIFSIAIPFSIFLRIISQTTLSFKKQLWDICIKVLARDFVSFILALIVVIYGGDVIGVSLTYLVAVIVATIIGFYILEKKVFSFFRDKIKSLFEVKEKITFALPLFFSAIFISVMAWTDTFFIGILRTATEVGIYNAALPLATCLGIFISAFAPIFYPIIGELLAKGQKDKIHQVYETNMRWMFMFAFPLLILILFFPKIIISSIFGWQYESGSVALMILSLTYFTNILLGLTFETLVCFNKTKLIFWLNSGAVAVNIGLDLLLIPRYGIEGAAAATGLAIVLRESIAFMVVRKEVVISIQWGSYLKSVLAAALALFMSFNSYYILQNYLGEIYLRFIFLIFFGASYILLLGLFKVMNEQDKQILRTVMEKFRFLTKIRAITKREKENKEKNG